MTGLDERGVGFRSLRESIDTTTAGGRLVFHLFGALAQFEREIIRDRTVAGLSGVPGPARLVAAEPALHAVLRRAWPTAESFVPQAVAQLPWGHVRVLLDKLSTRQERDWYAAAAGEYGWSRDVLVHQVETRLAERVGSGRCLELRGRSARAGLGAGAAAGATRTCSITWRCPSGSWSASSSRP